MRTPHEVTQCRVRITAPNGAQMRLSTDDAEQALLAVETSKDLGEACGSFTLVFAPVRDRDGRRWDQRIPKRSLVEITMRRADASQVIMVGLTDTHGMQSSYSEAHPRRQVQVSGREISCIIVDAHLWFNMALAAKPELGTLTVLSLDQAPQRVALTYNPNLAKAMEDPRTILGRMLDYYLFVGGAAIAPATTEGLQRPVIGLDIPHRSLSQLLDKNMAAWNTFVEGVTVPVVQFPAASGSLWNYLHAFIDRYFQEFFTRIEDGRCKIHFRGKPFLHALIVHGTRFKGSDGPASLDTEPTLQTLRLDPADVLSIAVRAQTSDVFNVFKAGPRGIDALYAIPTYNVQILPQIITDARHPSFVGRYGLRVLEAESPYLQPFAREVTPAAPTPQPLTPPPVGAAPWADTANTYATLEGVSPAHRPWFVALIQQESAFNPTARHKNPDGSEDQGIAQFNSRYTWTSVGLTDPFNPDNALPAAARYWQQLRAQVGDDPRLIAAAYNAGPQAVLTAKGIPPQAAQHVRNVTAYVPQHQHYAGTPPPKHGEEIPTPPEGRPGRPVPPRATTPAPTTPAPAAMNDMVQTARHWAAILRGWYDAGGELFSGVLVVRGHPDWNIGHRLLTSDEQGEWEAYIEGVRHTYDMRTGQYLTHLRITRGWYLAETIAQQIWTEGQTTVTDTSGGPPNVNPATGEEDVPIKSVTIIELEDFYRRFPAERPQP